MHIYLIYYIFFFSVCISSQIGENLNGTIAQASGWGDEKSKNFGFLVANEMTIVTNEFCKEKLDFQGYGKR